jgi:hypothetical protein
MICRRCGKESEKGWRFCPNCGSILEAGARSVFDDIFSRFRREFKEMDKLFDKDFEVLDLSPFFRSPRQSSPQRKGFTIKITRRNREHPRVDVRTFGDVNRDEVRKEVAEEMHDLGYTPEPATPKSRQPDQSLDQKPDEKPVKFTEEPRAEVRSIGTKVIVEMEMQDVKSEEDIRVSDLESSVEVRARAGDKAYFKIITKPERFSVTSKLFEKGRLHLEFS